MRSRVAVIGGGLAGTAAALRLADAGLAVTLLESRSRLGGVAGSFRRGELDVDTGQHVFLRCCTAYRGFVERLGATGDLTLQERLDVPVLSPTGRTARLRRSALPAPLHLAGALLRYRHLPLRSRLGPARAALALGRVDRATADDRSFGDWLAAHGQDDRAVDVLWDVVGIATLNARAGDASLALAATVFQLGLLADTAAGDIGWATAPLGALHDTAARRALAAAGVEVRRSAKVRALVQDGTRWRVPLGSSEREEELVVDRIVCAVPPGAAARLLPPGAVTRDIAALGSTPIVNVHVVYDRTVLREPFAAGVDSPVQWVFDRTAPSGAAAVYGPRAQYLAISLSAADDLVGVPAQRLLDRFLPALADLLPAARGAGVLDAFVTREPHATFRGAPGQAALRPGPRTALPGLYLAGAWTDTGWPATMEGAVRSGDSAAEAVLTERVPAGVAA
ncbi:hydroxysqualene dehydroxylase HpnE [Pseudonocardia xishanensis]|uniref:Hydroxysqualene dehydroxylase HpnE n=1 Tax=Pseudonocardia xishanensis TaxID=630995 RepID=A0ABP8S0S1_9PSEU